MHTNKWLLKSLITVSCLSFFRPTKKIGKTSRRQVFAYFLSHFCIFGHFSSLCIAVSLNWEGTSVKTTFNLYIKLDTDPAKVQRLSFALAISRF